MNRIRSWIEINPIIVKELRSRMRGGRTFLTLTIVLLLTGAALIGMILLLSTISSYGRSLLSPQVGSILFSMLITLELLVVCAVTPAVTSGAISSEIEKLTFDLLLATSLSPVQILWGKLFSALSYVLVLLFAAIPLASVVFVFGGVTLSSMAKAMVMLLLIAVMVGTIGLFFSALFRRTGRATVVSLLLIIALLLVPVFVSVVIAVINSTSDVPRWLLALSPISAVTSAILPAGQQSDSNPLAFIFLGGMLNQSLVPVSMTSIPRPVYHYSLVIFTALTIIFYMGAVSLVDPTRRWRLTRRQSITGLVILLVLAAVSVGGFLATADHYEWYMPAENAIIEPIPVNVAPFATPVETQRVIMPEEATPTPIPPPGGQGGG